MLICEKKVTLLQWKPMANDEHSAKMTYHHKFLVLPGLFCGIDSQASQALLFHQVKINKGCESL